MSRKENPRMYWLKHFIEEYQVVTPDGSEGEEEDIDKYVDGTEPLADFAAITRHTHDGIPCFYIYPVYVNHEAALNRAERYMDDDLFDETPVAVVDLLRGVIWKADIKVEWRKSEKLK